MREPRGENDGKKRDPSEWRGLTAAPKSGVPFGSKVARQPEKGDRRKSLGRQKLTRGTRNRPSGRDRYREKSHGKS